MPHHILASLSIPELDLVMTHASPTQFHLFLVDVNHTPQTYHRDYPVGDGLVVLPTLLNK